MLQESLGSKPALLQRSRLSLANLYIDIHADDRALALLSGVAMTGRAAGAKEHIRAGRIL